MACLQRLAELNSLPDINNYLMYLFMHMPGESDTLRSMAGLNVKNNVRMFYRQMSDGVREYIRANCLQGLADPSPLIRHTAGSLISEIHLAGAHWPELIPTLVNLVSTTQEAAVLEVRMPAAWCQETFLTRRAAWDRARCLRSPRFARTRTSGSR